MTRKWSLPIAWSLTLFLGVTLLSGQWWPTVYNTNERIEAEDLDFHSIAGTNWLTVGNGIGWIPHPDSTDVDSAYSGPWYPSEFVFARCGNLHWLCDDRVPPCEDVCADEYLSIDIDIPEEGWYLIYAYVANWADSAGIVDNRGCEHGTKWETGGWFVIWDDLDILDKVIDTNGELNVPREYIWKVFPYDNYCAFFNLDTVIKGYQRGDCPLSSPIGCDFESEQFNLTAGTHTLYLKVADEYSLLDWLYVAKVGDPPPTVEPGAPYDHPSQATSGDMRMPREFQLNQNYPNPFNAATVIRYTIPWNATVRLTIHDLLGHEVAALVNAEQSPGNYALHFDASGLSSGIYFYRLEVDYTTGAGAVGRYRKTKKMVYLR